MAYHTKPNKTFSYVGNNKSGQKAIGEIQAKSLILAKVDLLSQGIVIQKIATKYTPPKFRWNKKIGTADIAIFSRQLATMISSGIPLIRAFHVLSQGQSNPKISQLIQSIQQEIETGSSFSAALTKYPTHFNYLYCHLIAAGEKSGKLDLMLDKIATYREKIESIKQKVKNALTYPIAILVITSIITTCLLVFVVPQFESLFKSFGADLPLTTRIIIQLSRALQAYWYLILGGSGSVVYTLRCLYRKNMGFAQRIDRLALRVPLFGSVIKNAIIARFLQTLSITFAAGLPLIDALTTVGGVMGNQVFAKAILQIKEQISMGKPINNAIASTGLFPQIVIQMIAVGEESGTLEQMLHRVADFYEETVENTVDSLSSLLEPVIMSLLGIIVGGLVIAMYLPVFKLGSVI